MQKLFSQELRFKDENGNEYPAWTLTELSTIFKKYQNTIYLKDEQEYKRISISNKGIISHRDITLGKEIGRKRQYVIDLDNHPNTLTFIRQGVFLGGIGFIPKSLNHYIVTENMPLLSMNPNYNKLFMTYLFESEAYYKNVILKNMPIGSAQKSLHEKEWLQSIVSIPLLEEQEKIGNFFNKIDNLINLQANKVQLLKQRKQGLLQKMFV
ncbi:restriction endonuclease subunit S domain-containing protein [Staphylococcus capitis]|nr:restriction endonuclease subunit S [Staphylococcus capitis]MBF0712353.1 restriction endonuclease subunit S [Staphylococcus capitis]MBF2238593.1 restriction endonuclease subunit S [Staphylococcus capitis]MBF2243786.1 restriction endonuclease subunit S [Staphylococcus capitis]MBF2249230.1 restriction endonuclease subunit S [Staphylococcus capitis]MBF2251351.1 restriction endonuclease subunit S [Staphylococcus capitis]